jgi:hypothetical protein
MTDNTYDIVFNGQSIFNTDEYNPNDVHNYCIYYKKVLEDTRIYIDNIISVLEIDSEKYREAYEKESILRVRPNEYSDDSYKYKCINGNIYRYQDLLKDIELFGNWVRYFTYLNLCICEQIGNNLVLLREDNKIQQEGIKKLMFSFHYNKDNSLLGIFMNKDKDNLEIVDIAKDSFLCYLPIFSVKTEL